MDVVVRPAMEYSFTKYWNKRVPEDVKLGPSSYGELTIARLERELIKFRFSLGHIERVVTWDPNRVTAEYMTPTGPCLPWIKETYFDELWEDIQAVVAEAFVLRSIKPKFVFYITDHDHHRISM